MTARTKYLRGPVVWSTDKPITNRDEVLDLYWFDDGCQTTWIDKNGGIFRNLRDGNIYWLRVSYNLSNTWEVCLLKEVET